MFFFLLSFPLFSSFLTFFFILVLAITSSSIFSSTYGEMFCILKQIWIEKQ